MRATAATQMRVQLSDIQVVKIKSHLNRLGLRLERRIEEAVPAGQQLQELGMRLRCDDSGSEHVSTESKQRPRETTKNKITTVRFNRTRKYVVSIPHFDSLSAAIEITSTPCHASLGKPCKYKAIR